MRAGHYHPRPLALTANFFSLQVWRPKKLAPRRAPLSAGASLVPTPQLRCGVAEIAPFIAVAGAPVPRERVSAKLRRDGVAVRGRYPSRWGTLRRGARAHERRATGGHDG